MNARGASRSSSSSASSWSASSLSDMLVTLVRKPVIDRVRVSRSTLTHKGALIPVRVAVFGFGTLQLQNGPRLFVWGRFNQTLFVRADDAVCTLTFRGLWGRATTALPIGPLLSPTPGRAHVGRATGLVPDKASAVPASHLLPAPPVVVAPRAFRAPAARLPSSCSTMPSVGHAATLGPPARGPLLVRAPASRRTVLLLPDPPASRDGSPPSTEVIK